LLVYIVGEGIALSAMFGGSSFLWSIFFWSVGSFIIWGGLRRIKTIDKLFGSIVMAIILGLAILALPRFQIEQMFFFDAGKLFLPFGVILFALNGTAAIAEAHALLPNRARDFRKALIIGTLIPIFLYALFAISVVGFTGQATTEIATVGLGRAFGPVVSFIANLFAALAMCTGFIGLGTALRETLVWDNKLPDAAALFLVVSVPLALFLFGLRNFIGIIDVLGSVVIASETILMAMIYLKVRRG
ncbi:MAG: aromatic amino acid transport family protein, partial [Patescibacteria group bacterium]